MSKSCPTRSHGAKEGMGLFMGRQGVPEAPPRENQVLDFELDLQTGGLRKKDTRGDPQCLDKKSLTRRRCQSPPQQEARSPGAHGIGEPARGGHRDAVHPGHIAKRAAHDTYHHDRARDDALERVAPRSTFGPLQSGLPTHDQQTPPNPVEFQRECSQSLWQIDVWLWFCNLMNHFLFKN